MSKRFQLKVKEVVQETADAISIHFKQPFFKKVKYLPGQYLTLCVAIDGKQYNRCYSLCTSPHTDSTLAVTVKRVVDGVVSNYLNDNVKEGSKLEIMGPDGRFTIDPDIDNNRHVVLIGGGSGITPLMSILKTTLSLEIQTKVSLLYANRDEKNIIFKKELDDLQRQYSNNFKVVYFVDKKQNVNWNEGREGFLTPTALKEVLKELPQYDAEQTEYFLCGPGGLIDVVQATLTGLDIPKDTIHREFFVIEKAAVSIPSAAINTQRVKVRFEGEEHEIEVNPKDTILDAALAVGVDLPFSCQSGICCTCMGKLKSGKVHMDINEALSAKEIEEGFVLVCQSHPLTDDVVVEMQ
ncbi:MAG: FAD-binding oxidoreductase [Chitinophagales bacterium]